MDVLKAVFLAKEYGNILVCSSVDEMLQLVLVYRRHYTDAAGKGYDEFGLHWHPTDPFYHQHSPCECSRNLRYDKLSLVEQCLWHLSSLPEHVKHLFRRTYCSFSHRYVRLYHLSDDQYAVAFFNSTFYSPSHPVESDLCGMVRHITKTRAMKM